MKTKEISKLKERAQKARLRYDSCLGDISTFAKKYVEFPYDDIVFCDYQPSDGFVIVLDADAHTPYNMPMVTFFEIADKNGIVTIADFKTRSI